MAESQLVARFILVADIAVVALTKERFHRVSVVTDKTMAVRERCEHLATYYGIASAPHGEVQLARSMRGCDPAIYEAKITDSYDREGGDSRCDDGKSEEEQLRL